MRDVEKAAPACRPESQVVVARTLDFSSRRRLHNSKEFARVFSQPFKSSDTFFTILASHNNLDYPRLGLAISKKVLRLSVARNRVKRLIRESFRQQSVMLCGLDIVVMARRGLDNKNNRVLLNALQQHWGRVEKLCKESS